MLIYRRPREKPGRILYLDIHESYMFHETFWLTLIARGHNSAPMIHLRADKRVADMAKTLGSGPDGVRAMLRYLRPFMKPESWKLVKALLKN